MYSLQLESVFFGNNSNFSILPCRQTSKLNIVVFLFLFLSVFRVFMRLFGISFPNLFHTSSLSVSLLYISVEYRIDWFIKLYRMESEEHIVQFILMSDPIILLNGKIKWDIFCRTVCEMNVFGFFFFFFFLTEHHIALNRTLSWHTNDLSNQLEALLLSNFHQ